MDFEACLKAHNLIYVQYKSSKLGQTIHLNEIFYVVVSNYQLVNTTNSPQFLAQPRNGLFALKNSNN